MDCGNFIYRLVIKKKIREQSPKELHVLGNKVYDETLKEVRKGENK